MIISAAYSVKKTHELHHVLHFKEVCPLFPEGEIENTERPDFVVRARDKALGIEHTEVFQPGPSHGGSLQAQDSLAQKVVEKARHLYTQSHNQPLHVQVLFNLNLRLRKQNIDAIAQNLVHVIEEAHIDLDIPVTLKRTRNTLDRFPKEIAFVHICHPGGKADRWRCSSAGFVPEMMPEHLQAIIGKKERKLDNYTSEYSELWLLIVANDLRIPSTVDLDESALAHRYESRFDRVFFFWNASRRFVELQLIGGRREE